MTNQEKLIRLEKAREKARKQFVSLVMREPTEEAENYKYWNTLRDLVFEKCPLRQGESIPQEQERSVTYTPFSKSAGQAMSDSPINFGKYKGSAWGVVPISYLRFLVDKNAHVIKYLLYRENEGY
jgi:hypothetical protein